MLRMPAIHNYRGFREILRQVRRERPRRVGVSTEGLEARWLLAAPVITNQAFSVNENTAFLTPVGTVAASDADGDALTFQIVGGNVNNAFAINPQTGQVIIDNAAAVNFEVNPQVSLQVQVRDPGFATATATVTISIANVNEAPVITSQVINLPENPALGQVVGSVTAIDEDAGDALTFAITSGNVNGAFALNASTGVITVANPGAINFESITSFDLGIEVTDNGGGAAAAVWNAQNIGPIQNGQTEGIPNNPVAGAIHVVLPHPTNPDILYVGGVNGGIWKTTNAQAANPDWTPLADLLPSLSIGAMAFDSADATRNTVWAGFGRNSSLASTGGRLAGLTKTTDGGQTWQLVDGGGSMLNKQISGIAVNGNVVVVSVRSGGADGGIWRSTDGGTTFSQISQGNGTATGLPGGTTFDLVFDPINPNVLYTPVAFAHNFGGQSGVYKSSDGGATWARSTPDAVTNKLGAGVAVSNIEMATGRNGDVYVGILIQGVFDSVFRSGNSGGTWTQLDTPVTNEGGTNQGLNPSGVRGPGDANGDGVIDSSEAVTIAGGQGSIHFSMAADPTNANVVYLAGDRQPNPFPNSLGAQNFTGRLFRVDASKAAGQQATSLTHQQGVSTISNSAPHADSRDMAFDAAGNLLEGDDGGLYKRTNPQGLGDWRSVMGTSLLNTEFHSLRFDSLTNTLIGGTQDVGTAEQRTTGQWVEVNQGDGGKTAVDNVAPDSSIRYNSSQFLGGLRWRELNAAGTQVAQGSVNTAGINAQFYTEIETNNVVQGGLAIAGSNGVFISFDRGATFTSIGGPAGDSIFGNGLVFGGQIGAATNQEVVWYGGNGGVFLRTTAGSSLAPVTSYPGATPTDIVVDPTDWQHVIVTDDTSVYRSTDGGANWTNITGDLVQSQIGTVEYVQGPGVDAIAIGSQDGVFTMLLSAVGTWTELAANLPNTPVRDLDVDMVDGILSAGLQGRGGWLIGVGSIFQPTIGDPITATGALTINVNDVNEAPASAGRTVNVPENRSIGVTVLTALPATDPDGGTLTYSIVAGDPTGAFAINSTTGRITVADPTYFNFEVNPTTVLTVRVTDSGSPALFVEVPVTVNLTDLNDRPVISPVAYSVPVQPTNGTIVGQLGAVTSDEDVGQTLSYSIVAGNTDGAFVVNIATGEVRVANGAALTAGRVFNVRFRVTDNGSAPLAMERIVPITVDNPNNPPVIVPGQSFNIIEGSAANAFVGRVLATDVDAGQTRVFAILSGNTNGTFTIDPNTGDLRVANPALLDHETNPVFTLQIQATDNGTPSASGVGDVTINVTNRNEAPVFEPGAFTITEHSRVGSVAGVARASDIDPSQVLTYAIIAGNTRGTFAIDPATGRITVANKDTLNFETTPLFNLTVRVTDNGSPALSATQVFPVTVQDINERPLIKNRIASVAENRVTNATVTSTIVIDPDQGQTRTFAIVGGNTGGAFKIDEATGVIRVNKSAQLDFEGPTQQYVLKIRATDDGTPTLFGEGFVTINVTDVNEPATLPLTTFTLPENSPANTVVGTVVGQDPDAGQTLTYAISAGNIGGAFIINPATGQIRVANSAALDFETRPKFTLTISMTDNGSPVRTGAGTVIVNLTDAEDAPVVTPKSVTVRENAPTATFVTKVLASDQDPGDTFSFSITGGNVGNTFSISPTGDIRVNNPALLNFEGAIPFWDLLIRATDDANPAVFGEATVRVTLVDINEAPLFVDQTFTLPENSPIGTSAGVIAASDPDPGQSLTYSFVSGNIGNAFALNPTTGEITVNVASLMDYETRPTFGLRIRVTDNGSPAISTIATVTVNLTDANDPPVVVGANFNVDENSPVGTIVGTVTANDQDGHPVRWTIRSGNTNNAFALNPSTGEIKVNNSAALDYETIRSFTLTVRATDSGVPAQFGEGQVRIFLNDLVGAREAAPAFSLTPKSTNVWL